MLLNCHYDKPQLPLFCQQVAKGGWSQLWCQLVLRYIDALFEQPYCFPVIAKHVTKLFVDTVKEVMKV